MCYIILDFDDNFIKAFSSLRDLFDWLDRNNNYQVAIYYISFNSDSVCYLQTISKFN